MIQLIIGAKGKGKTKLLLDRANEAVKKVSGNIVYVDKSDQNMFELSNKIRLIDASKLPLKNADQFLGAVFGIISQDHDLEQVYLDSFLKLAKIEDKPELLEAVLSELEEFSKEFKVDFVVSVSIEKEALSEKLQALVDTSL